MRRALILLVLVFAACGSSSTTAATTTTTAPTTTTVACPTTFTFGTTRLPPECREQGLTAALRSQNVTADATGPTQAQAVCRKVSLSGPTMGLVDVLADWATGTSRPPVAEKDQSTFIVMAVAVYCPDYWDAVRTRG